MSRKLASIQTVSNISLHDNADNLVLVTILGWQIVARKDEVSIGNKIIYCEIDSLLPIDASWLPQSIKERIKKENHKDYFRVRTVKLRGKLSQGLIIPIIDTIVDLSEKDVGTDVTDILNIKKYEPNEFGGHFYNSGNNIPFPTKFLSKTDEPRIQSNPHLLTQLQGKSYYTTVKLDGTSATYFINPDTDEFTVCSRNFIRSLPPNDHNIICPYWFIANKLGLEQILRQSDGKFIHLAIQGEICGPHVQKNLLALKDLNFFVFNLVDLTTRQHLPMNLFTETCSTLGLVTIPIETVADNFNVNDISELLSKAKGKYVNTNNDREGLVIRAQDQSISFKVINNDYLLKHNY